MWPQLLALLPHITRIVPLADRYFQNRATTEKAHEEAFARMSTALRTDLADLTAAHSSLNRQFQEQSLQLAQLADESRRTRVLLESGQHRSDLMQAQLTSLTRWFKIAAIAIVVLLTALIFLAAELIHTR